MIETIPKAPIVYQDIPQRSDALIREVNAEFAAGDICNTDRFRTDSTWTNKGYLKRHCESDDATHD